MKVTVHLHGQARTAAAGNASMVVELNVDATVRHLVSQLCDTHGPALRGLLLAGQDCLAATVLIFVGDQQMDVDDLHLLQDGDEITFLTPIAGGC